VDTGFLLPQELFSIRLTLSLDNFKSKTIGLIQDITALASLLLNDKTVYDELTVYGKNSAVYGKAITGIWKSDYGYMEKRLRVYGKAITGIWKSDYGYMERPVHGNKLPN
jgi:hypothetical protein